MWTVDQRDSWLTQHMLVLSDVSTETYSNSDNFASSNARVSERDFWYSLQGLFLDTIEETDWQEQLIS